MLRGVIALLQMAGIPRLLFRLMLDRRVPVRLKLIPIGALIYLVLPHDLVPDIIPAFGRIDDVFVILFSILLFLGMAPRDVVSENIRGKRDKGTPKDDQSIVDGTYRIIDEDDKDDEEKSAR